MRRRRAGPQIWHVYMCVYIKYGMYVYVCIYVDLRVGNSTYDFSIYDFSFTTSIQHMIFLLQVHRYGMYIYVCIYMYDVYTYKNTLLYCCKKYIDMACTYMCVYTCMMYTCTCIMYTYNFVFYTSYMYIVIQHVYLYIKHVYIIYAYTHVHV